MGGAKEKQDRHYIGHRQRLRARFMEAGADMAKPMGLDTIAEIKRAPVERQCEAY